jgi:uncharacterized membrane protein
VPAFDVLRRFMDLIACMAVSVIMIASAVASLGGSVFVPLGALLVLLVPGYSITCAIWDSESDMTVADRVAFSVGLSVALSIFTVLALSVFGIGVFPLSVVIALGYESLIFTVLAFSFRWARHQGIPHEIVESFTRSRTAVASDRAFWAVVAVLLVAAAILLGLIFSVPTPTPGTQIYVLGPDGTASSLPSTIVANRTVSILVGAYNGLGQSLQFTVTVCLIPTNGTCSTPPVSVANWSTPLLFGANGSYALGLDVGSATTTQKSLQFLVSVPGGYALSLALDGGAVHREVRLPLSVTP